MLNFFTRTNLLRLNLFRLIFLIPFLSIDAHALYTCDDLFKENSPQSVHAEITSGAVEVNGVKVTGQPMYEIKRKLNLDLATLKQLKNQGAKVLSLGEGFSGLLPTLVDFGISVKGLDIWYHSKQLNKFTNRIAIEMAEFQKMYAAYLIRGSALDIPLKNESMNFIVSHGLAENLHIAEVLKMISEGIRVLSVNGEARILLSSYGNISPAYQKAVLSFIVSNYQNNVSAEVTDSLLTVKKTSSTTGLILKPIPFDPDIQYPDLPVGSLVQSQNSHKALQTSYSRLVEAIQKRPDNINLQIELQNFLNELRSIREQDLEPNSNLRTILNKINSLLTIKPEQKID